MGTLNYIPDLANHRVKMEIDGSNNHNFVKSITFDDHLIIVKNLISNQESIERLDISQVGAEHYTC